MRTLLLCLLALLLLAAAPPPTGHVNDLANIIPDEREAVIENSLRSYASESTNQVAVVTTPSLEGQEIEEYTNALFRQWGVGQRGTNNGILVVVAPNERKWRIEVGYGLEGDLTDADAATMGRSILPAAFRAGDYAGGIENLTAAIIEHIGTQTPEQRSLLAAEQQRAQQATSRGFFTFLLLLGAALFAALMLYVIVYAVRSAIDDSRKRKTVLKAVARAGKTVLIRQIELSKLDLTTIPRWMSQNLATRLRTLQDRVEQIMLLRQELSRLGSAATEGDLTKLEAALRAHGETFVAVSTVHSQVDELRETCATNVAKAATLHGEFVAYFERVRAAGYNIDAIVSGDTVSDLWQSLETLRSSFERRGEGVNDTSDQVQPLATDFINRVTTLKNALERHVQMHTLSDVRIRSLRDMIPTLPALLAMYRQKIERFKGEIPESRWKDFEDRLPELEVAIATLTARTNEAEQANSMEAQTFSNAAMALDAAEKQLEFISDCDHGVTSLETKFELEKKHHHSKLADAKSKIGEAAALMSNGDVGSQARNLLASARSKLGEIRLGETLVDYIAVNALIEESAILASRAISQAKQDISDCERERELAEAERRRRQHAAAAAAAAAEIRASNNDDSGSSFDGFGGGSSGGGGASGSW